MHIHQNHDSISLSNCNNKKTPQSSFRNLFLSLSPINLLQFNTCLSYFLQEKCQINNHHNGRVFNIVAHVQWKRELTSNNVPDNESGGGA